MVCLIFGLKEITHAYRLKMPECAAKVHLQEIVIFELNINFSLTIYSGFCMMVMIIILFDSYAERVSHGQHLWEKNVSGNII